MRIQTGGAISVTATELWYDDIRAGRAFVRGSLVDPSVGNFSEIQLFNPVGSGVNLIVRAVIISLSVADNVRIRTHDVALATLAATGANLLANAAVGKGEVRTATPAVVDGTQVARLYVAANTPVYPVPDWFFELGPGEGFLVVPFTVNVGIACTYFWKEV